MRRGSATLALALALTPGLARAQRAAEVFGGQEIATPRGSIPYLKRIPTDAEIRRLLATADELQPVAYQPAVNEPQSSRGEIPASRVKDVAVEKWHMPGAGGPTRGSFAVLKLTSELMRQDGQATGLRSAQAVFLGYRKPDQPLSILHGYLPDEKGRYTAPPVVEGRSAEERDRQLAQVIAGAQPGFAPGVPERVQITVASALASRGSVHVEGSILSGTPITSTLFMRSEGGEPKQGFIDVSGGSMTASCEMAPRVVNVFKITADNEARLGGEVTLTFDAGGKLVSAKSTSTEGDVTSDATAPGGVGSVPGLGGVGSVPGPATQGQAAAGILTPALLAILLHGLLGGGIGGGPTPPVPPGGKGPRHHGTGTPSGTDGGTDDEAGDEEGGEGEAGGKGKARGPGVKPAAHVDASKEGPKGAEPKASGSKPGAAPPGAPPPKPSAAAPTTAEKEALDKLAWLEHRAKSSHSPELTKALAEAKQGCVRPDGSLDLDRWKASQRGLWEALGAYGRQGEAPNSYLGDLGREIGYAPVQAARMAGGAAVDIVKGIGGLAVSGAKGIRDIGDGLLHPGYFLSGAKTKTNEWVAKNCPEESRALQQAAVQGRPLDALAAMGRTAAKAGGGLLASAAHFVKTEVLPVDEIGSFFDKDASLEERLWAVPAAATKIAGLLLGGTRPTAVPSTRIGTAIQGAAQRQGLAATEAAAAQQAARLEAQVASLQKAAARAEGTEGGVRAVLDRTQKALEGARQARDAAKAVQRVQELAPQALKDAPAIQNLKDAMRRLDGNPELKKAADEAIRANDGGNALYKQRVDGNMSQDAHTLVTARKVQLQNEAMNNATKRILEEDVAARLARGEGAPGRYSTFNASQGSRSRLSGANVNVDYDQTIVGLGGLETNEQRLATSARVQQVLHEECGRLGQSPKTLDVNVYTPQRGLADASGAAPNAQATLENIGQTTGTAGHHSVHVTADKRIVVGDHVSTLDGREGVLAGRRTMEPPPGVSREQWLREGAWEGQQGQPIQVPREQWPAVRQAQMDGLHHALERGDMNQMVKYANRARTVGLPVSESTERLLRAVAGQKDPYLAQQLLSDAGVASPADLMQKLGLS